MSEPDDTDLYRARAEADLAVQGERITAIAGALNAIYAAHKVSELPDSIFYPLEEHLRSASRHLQAGQRVDSILLRLDYTDDAVERARLRDELLDLGDRHPALVERIREGGVAP